MTPFPGLQELPPTNQGAPIPGSFGTEGRDFVPGGLVGNMDMSMPESAAPPQLPQGESPLDSVVMAEDNPLRLALMKSEDERVKVGKHLQERIEYSLTQLRDRHDLIRLWRDMYDARAQRSDWPWEGASEISIPMIQSITDTIHANVLRVCRGVTPYFNISASKSGDEEIARKIQEGLHWQLSNQMEYGDKLDEILRIALDSANCFAHLPWRKTVGMAMSSAKIDEALLASLLADGEDPAVIENLRQQAASGSVAEIPVEQETVVYDAPAIETVDPLDFIMYPVNSPTLDAAQFIGHRVWMSRDDLLTAVISGEFEEDRVNELLGSPPQTLRSDETSGADQTRVEGAGIYDTTTLCNDDLPYEMYRLLVKYRVRENKPAVWCVFVVERATGLVVKATRYPNWHGEPDYINYCPYPIAGQVWGRSVPDILRHLSEEVDAIRNSRVNAGTLALTPVFIQRRGSTSRTDGRSFSPGDIIEADDVDGIKQLTVNPPTQAAFAEEDKAQREAEKVTGASDVMQGVSAKGDTTLGETQLMLQAGNAKFEVIVGRVQKANTALARQTLGLMRQHMTAEQEFAITGTSEFEFMAISPRDMRARVNLAPHGNTLNSNPQLEMQIAEKVWMMMERIPWAKPENLYAAGRNLLIKSGVKNVIPYLGTEEQAMESGQQEPPPPQPNITLSLRPEPPVVNAMLDMIYPGMTEKMQPTNQPQPTGGQMPPGPAEMPMPAEGMMQ